MISPRIAAGRLPFAAAAVALLATISIAVSLPHYPERFADVRAFYCAGRAVLDRADPYREHPLNDCERIVRAPALSPLRDGVTVPAPFPGCVLALFALFALLPFGAALPLWTVLTSLALMLAVGLISRLTHTPVAACAIVVVFPAATIALPLGQLTPFVLLAIAGTAALLEARRPAAAALVALGALLDPHVGLALVLGLAVAVPRTRAVLVTGGATLAIAGTGIVGYPVASEYVRAVLPAHALANVSDSGQFSATHFAYVAGLPAAPALALGSAWYVIALAVGIAVALRLRGRLGIASVAFVPPAFVVIGGTHTHLAQLAMAVPAFLLVCAHANGARRAGLTILTFVGAIPWLGIAPFPLLFPATAVLAIAFARTMEIDRQGARIAAASFATLTAIFVAIVRSHSERGPLNVRMTGNPLAEASWQIAMLARNVPTESWYLFAKAPTVIAFLMLFGVLINAALSPRAFAREC